MGKHITIIDDHDDVLRMISYLLKAEGYRVLAYNDSYKAIAEFSNSKMKTDLFLLDVSMPKINGLELLQLLKECEQLAAAKYVFITSFRDKIIKETAEAEAVLDIIRKPFDHGDFVKRIASYFADDG